MLEQGVPLEEVTNRVQEVLEQGLTRDMLGADAVDLDVHCPEVALRIDQKRNNFFHIIIADAGETDLADAASVRVGCLNIDRDEPVALRKNSLEGTEGVRC
ncbi:hypothetical protein GCM10011415_02450 [Salipiger pallidus]|uniref:Uncharacterized protein n=1 Tax=Salipiger pallidus TaxID=1775170 RepID=A0A8J2ZGE0_9RHOB|nr:hypothetical protein GCM10011415_02450 [Salipiger pallidus]